MQIIHTAVLYPKLPLQRWLEDPVERALFVSAVSEVEDVFDNFLALLEVSCPGVVEACWKSLRFLAGNAGAVVDGRVVPGHAVARVETRIRYCLWT